MRRSRIAALVIAGGVLSAGGFAGGASAASHPTFQTVQKNEVLVSAKCIDVWQQTKTYYHWSKGAYVKYPKPKVTTTTSRTCHK